MGSKWLFFKSSESLPSMYAIQFEINLKASTAVRHNCIRKRNPKFFFCCCYLLNIELILLERLNLYTFNYYMTLKWSLSRKLTEL